MGNILNKLGLVSLLWVLAACSGGDGTKNSNAQALKDQVITPVSPTKKSPIRDDILDKHLLFETTMAGESLPQTVLVLSRNLDGDYVLSAGEDTEPFSPTMWMPLSFNEQEFTNRGMFSQSADGVKMESFSGGVNYPFQAKAGEKLADGTFEMGLNSENGQKIQMKYTINNRQILKAVQEDTPIGTLSCYVVAADIHIDSNMLNGVEQIKQGAPKMVMQMQEHFCPEIGMASQTTMTFMGNAIQQIRWVKIKEDA